MLIFWIIAAVLLVGVELLTPGFVALFFALAAFLSAVSALFTDNILIQCVVFAVSALLMVPFGRPLLQKYFKVNKEVKASTVDALIGKIAFVTKDILPDDLGLVKFEGQVWTARAEDDEKILTGQAVRIRAIEGAKVVVSKIHKEEL